jgi:hypothetical protein
MEKENGHLMSEGDDLQFQRGSTPKPEETSETITDTIVSMPASTERSSQNSNVFREHGITSGHRSEDTSQCWPPLGVIGG